MMDLVKTLHLEGVVKQYGLEDIINQYGLIILIGLVILAVVLVVLLFKLIGLLFKSIFKGIQSVRARNLKYRLHHKHYYYGSFDVGSHGGINQYACGFRWNFDVYFNDNKNSLSMEFYVIILIFDNLKNVIINF